MIVTNNKKLADKARMLSVFGMVSIKTKKDSSHFVIPKFIKQGYNYKMSDITAAVGIAQLRKINQIIKRKRELAKYWNQRLQEISLINSPFVNKNSFHVYQSYVALVDKKVNRDKLIKYLKNKNIQTQIGTYSSYIQPVYQSKQKCPVSLDIFNRALALPMYYTLKKKDIDKIIFNLKKYECKKH
jgi:dTDP-4-amino-4,6-dideoxygalactose transaminase